MKIADATIFVKVISQHRNYKDIYSFHVKQSDILAMIQKYLDFSFLSLFCNSAGFSSSIPAIGVKATVDDNPDTFAE